MISFCSIVTLLAAAFYVIFSSWFLHISYSLDKASQQYSTNDDMIKACRLDKSSGRSGIVFGWISVGFSILIFCFGAFGLIFK